MLNTCEAKVDKDLIYDTVGRFPRNNGDSLFFSDKATEWDYFLENQITQKIPTATDSEYIEASWVRQIIRPITQRLDPIIESQLKVDHPKGLIPIKQGDKIIAYASVNHPLPGSHQAINALRSRISGCYINSTIVKLSPSRKSSLVLIPSTPQVDPAQCRAAIFYKAMGLPLSKFLSTGNTITQLEANLDRRFFTLKFLETLLISPWSEEPEHLMVEEFTNLSGKKAYRLLSTYNTIIGCNAVSSEKDFQRNLIYCFDQMKSPLDLQAIEEFLVLDPSSCLKHWLHWAQLFDDRIVGNKKEHVQGIFNIREIIAIFNKNPDNPCFLPFRLERGLVQRLLNRFMHIRKLLIDYEKTPTHIELLCEFEHLLGRPYRHALENKTDPLQRYAELGEFKDTLTPAVIKNQIRKTLKTKTDLKEPDIALVLSEDMENNFYRPAHAILDELYNLDEEAIQITNYYQEIKAKNFDVFRKQGVRPYIKSKIVSQYSEELKSDKPPTLTHQQQMLTAMIGTPFPSLELSYWKILTVDLLQPILKGSNYLRSLNISGCPELTSQVPIFISKYCPYIEELHLSDLSQLTVINNSILFFDTKLSFHNLRRLTLHACENLKQINIEAPNLQALSIRGCIKLTNLVLHHSQFQHKAKRILHLNSGSHGAYDIAELAYKGTTIKCNHSRAFGALASSLRLTGHSKQESSTLVALLELIDRGQKTQADFSHCNINPSFLYFITLVAAQSRCLISLNLEATQLNAESVKHLTNLLLKNTPLQTLMLGHNAIKDLGAEALSNALISNHNLNTLNLDSSEITDKGTISIGRALQNNNTLFRLSLRGNTITTQGIQALSESLVQNKGLIHLELDENVCQISESAPTSLQKIMQRKQTQYYHETRYLTTFLIFASSCKSSIPPKDDLRTHFTQLTMHILTFIEGDKAKPLLLPESILAQFFTKKNINLKLLSAEQTKPEQDESKRVESKGGESKRVESKRGDHTQSESEGVEKIILTS